MSVKLEIPDQLKVKCVKERKNRRNEYIHWYGDYSFLIHERNLQGYTTLKCFHSQKKKKKNVIHQLKIKKKKTRDIKKELETEHGCPVKLFVCHKSFRYFINNQKHNHNPPSKPPSKKLSIPPPLSTLISNDPLEEEEEEEEDEEEDEEEEEEEEEILTPPESPKTPKFLKCKIEPSLSPEKKIVMKDREKKSNKIETYLLSNKFLKEQIAIVVGLLTCPKNNSFEATNSRNLKDQKLKEEKLRKELFTFYNKGKKQRKLMNKERKAVDKMLKKNPEDYELLKRKIELTMAFRPEKCISIAQTLLRVIPNDKIDVAYAWYGGCLRNCRKHYKAMEYVKKALHLNPKNGLALKVKVALYGEPEFSSSISEHKILDLINLAISTDPKNVSFLFEKVWVLKEFGKFEESRKILETCFNQMTWKDQKIYYSFLSAIEDLQGASKKCVLNALRSVLLEPRTITGLCMLSCGYDHFGEYKKSLEITKLFTGSYVERCGSMDDNQKLFLANCYYNSKEYMECLKLAGETLKNRNSTQALTLIGYCYFDQAKYIDSAKILYLAILKSTANSSILLRSYGLVLYEIYIEDPSISMSQIFDPSNCKKNDVNDKIINLRDILTEKEKSKELEFIGTVLENSCFALTNASHSDSFCFNEIRKNVERGFKKNRDEQKDVENDWSGYCEMFRTFGLIFEKRVNSPFANFDEHHYYNKSNQNNIEEEKLFIIKSEEEIREIQKKNIFEIYKNLYLYVRSYLWVLRILYFDDFCEFNVGTTLEDRDLRISKLFDKLEPFEEIQKRREFMILENEDDENNQMFRPFYINCFGGNRIELFKLLVTLQ